MIRAILFDLDGTLADTERLHWRAYHEVLRPYGIDVPLDEYRRHWIATGTGAEYVCERYGLPMTPAELRTRKGERFSALIRHGVNARPGVHTAIGQLHQAYGLAVVTNTGRADLETVLGHLGLAHWFEAAVAREDYGRAKPAPDCYVIAAGRLGVRPEECIVIEDSERGVRAGVAAGMTVIAVPNDLTDDNDCTGAACRLGSLSELDRALLERVGRGRSNA